MYTAPALTIRGDVVRDTLASTIKNGLVETGEFKPQSRGSVGFYL
jgi:hypothetical protein